MRSVFTVLSEDTNAHPAYEIMSSSSLWYFGEYPWNNTELFVRVQPDSMTWGEWKNAATVLAIFYDTFSTVSLSFEVALLQPMPQPHALAYGRFSLYDRI